MAGRPATKGSAAHRGRQARSLERLKESVAPERTTSSGCSSGRCAPRCCFVQRHLYPRQKIQFSLARNVFINIVFVSLRNNYICQLTIKTQHDNIVFR
jgi:hypothetical protein